MNWWWFKIKIHPTWQLTVGLLAIVVGLALSPLVPDIYTSYSWLVMGVMIAIYSLIKPTRIMLLGAVLGGLLIGMSRGAIDIQALGVFDAAYGAEITISGQVREDPDRGERGSTALQLSSLRSGDIEVPGALWVNLDTKNEIRRSDIVTLRGTLQEGFGSFSGAIYRAEIINVERPMPGDVALDVRDDFARHVRLGIDEPAASLGIGYLTGQRSSLPDDLDDALRLAGLTHIVVASGYNLTILVRLVKRLFEKRSRYLTVYLSSLLIIGFIGVTGLSPSMTRAGLVAGLALLAWYFGRKYHPVTLLAIAAAVTGLINPSYVWGNLGWQLSFAAFAGVMVLAPLLQAYFFGDKKPGMVRQVVGETVSAQLATAPLLLFAFGQISNVAVIANVLVVPLVPLAMLTTFITGLAGYVTPGLAQLVGTPVQWLLDYMVWVAKSLAGVTWAQTEWSIGLGGLIVAVLGFIGLAWYLKRATGYRLRDASIVE